MTLIYEMYCSHEEIQISVSAANSDVDLRCDVIDVKWTQFHDCYHSTELKSSHSHNPSLQNIFLSNKTYSGPLQERYFPKQILSNLA